MVERALVEMQRLLERHDHLGAAGMAGEAVDRVPGHADAVEDAVDCRSDFLLGEWRDVAIEHHAQPFIVDIPAHDVERVGPHMLAGAFDLGDAALARAQNAGRSAVGEKCGRHHVGLGELIEPERRRAELDRHHQHCRAGPRFGQPARNRHAADAAGAAQPEDRHALDVAAETHAARHARFEAGRGDAGRGDSDDRVDLAGAATRRGDRLLGGGNEKILRALDIDRHALGPAHRLQVPFERPDHMARFDAGRTEDARHAGEIGEAAGEGRTCRLGSVGLQQAMGRNGRGERDQAGASGPVATARADLIHECHRL